LPAGATSTITTTGPRGGLRLLTMRLLLGGEEMSRASADAIAAAGSWGDLITLGHRWKVLPGIEKRLLGLGVTLPGPERADLDSRMSSAFVQSTLSIRAGLMALGALEAAKIPCAAFKGVAALAFLHAGPRARTLQDVDVLVHPEDAEAAVRVLEAAGFHRSFKEEWGTYLAFVRNSPGFAGNEAISLTDGRGGVVDLHWRLGVMDSHTLLGRVEHRNVLNRPLPVVSPGHAMLLTAHHALRNDFVPDDIARDVCDFAAWTERLGDSGPSESIGAAAEEWGLQQTCLALATIAAELRGAPCEVTGNASVRERAGADRLAALYFHQLQDGAWSTDLTYLASPRPLLQILAGVRSGWKQYRASMQRMEALNGEPSPTLATRVGRLLRAATHLSPRQWRQLRALAKAKDGVAAVRVAR
jgi:hypothetical protein